MTSPPAEVSIVIVTWNSRDAVLDCLASLNATPASRSCEVIVVDNGSHDGTVDAVRREQPWVRVIANPANRGLAAANNQGIAASCGTYLVVSNPDVVYRAGSIDALCDLLDRRPRAAIAFAKLLDPDGSLQTCAGSLPSLAEALRGRAARESPVSRDPQHQRSGFWWHGWSHDEEVEIGHGGEACYAVRRTAIAEIGVQDERFRLDWEGVDWTARAIESGWQVWFCPAAEVVHVGGLSIRQARARWIVWSHRGMYLYFARRRPSIRPLLAVLLSARALAKLATLALPIDVYGRAH